MNKFYLFVLLVCLMPRTVFSENEVSIIPLPAKMNVGNEYFLLSPNTQLLVEDNALFAGEVNHFQTYIKTLFDKYLPYQTGENKIIVKRCSQSKEQDSYTLEITLQEITISAQNEQGLFYAFQTLKQLIQPNRNEEKIAIPTLSIYDYPSYEWRGMMLDVSRHFFTPEYLKQQIDILAYYKFNRLHLHLTDDQGWRIEIKQYPELTQQSAWRTFNKQDSLCIKQAAGNPDMTLDPRFLVKNGDRTLYGGYYTQDELKDLIQYAQERHIEIIPEIDMPGHMMAAISAYPELSCIGEATWGELFSVPLCPCNENVYTFLENILDEVISLFPSKYIHIGADEVEKHTWKESLVCKELMQREQMESVEQLQSYFIERIQKYLTSKGKELIAWDEALDGGINSDVNIMFWRDWVGGVPEKIIANGNRIIFTPGYPLYLSRQDSALYDIYHLKTFTTIPAKWKHLVLGAQASIWTERIPSEDRANHLIYPRILALSEITWTPNERRNWDSFKKRLEYQKEYLMENKIKYASTPSMLIPQIKTDINQKAVLINFDSEKIAPEIYYTLDGTVPTKDSYPYKGTINISNNAQICAGIFENGKLHEPLFRRSVDYHKAIGKPVKYFSSWNKSYPAEEELTLTDGYRGGERYNDGYWQGFTSDMEIVIDMKEMTNVSRFATTFMQLVGPGVYMPEYVEVSISTDNRNYEKVLLIPNDVGEKEKELTFKTFSGSLKNKKARYIKVYAKNKSSNRFMFTDEIVVY